MEASNKARVKFEKGNLDFQQTLRKRVDEYFTSNNIEKHANGQMIFKTILILVLLLSSYTVLITANLPLYALFIVSGVLGFSCALVGLNIGHDAIHGAYSTKPRINKAIGTMFNFMGANDYMWAISHNVVHHTYTNILDHDEDISPKGLFRFTPHSRHKKIHRYQHLYVWFFYSLMTLSWIVFKDWKQLRGYVKNGLLKKHQKLE